MAIETKYVGARKEIGFAKETTRGTVVDPASGGWKPHEDFDFSPKVNKAAITSASGSIADREGAEIVQEWAEGSIPMLAAVEFMGDLANMIAGKAPDTSASVGGGYYQHDWDALISNGNANRHVSYTVTIKDPIAGGKQHALAMLNTFSLEAGVDDFVKLALNMIAKKEASATVNPTYSTTDSYFKPSALQWFVASTYAGLTGATALPTSNISVNGNKNAVPVFAHGSTQPEDIINQRLGFNGSFTLPYTNTTLRDYGLSDNYGALRLKLVRGTYVFQITFPSVDFSDWNHDPNREQFMPNTVTFNANYKDKTNGFCKIQVIDTASSH